jgi:hypothetical protein
MTKANKYLVMLGVGDDRKARAARFDLPDEAGVRRAAGLLNFRVGFAKGDAACAQAGKLPEGKLSESGLGMVPLVAEDKFYLLFKLLSFDAAWDSAGIIPGRPQVTDAAILEAAEKLWSGIKVGSVVLAFDGSDAEAFGWSAAVVVSIDDKGQTLHLRYRDWPGFKTFQANARSVALLHPELCP